MGASDPKKATFYAHLGAFLAHSRSFIGFIPLNCLAHSNLLRQSSLISIFAISEGVKLLFKFYLVWQRLEQRCFARWLLRVFPAVLRPFFCSAQRPLYNFVEV